MGTRIRQFSDNKLDKIWGNADFGDSTQRQVILGLLKKTSQNFHSGSTATAIGLTLGIIKKTSDESYHLTGLGLAVLLTNKDK